MELPVMAAVTVWSFLCGTAVLLLVAWAVEMLNCSWWTPRRLESALRAQGLDGRHYRDGSGEDAQLLKEALAKPMPLSHDIIPRIAPLLHRAIEKYGKASFAWFGSRPGVILTDADLVREVLLNKSGHCGKPTVNKLTRHFIEGLATYEGEKWAKHRRILNPAFHVEKLKVIDSWQEFLQHCRCLLETWNDSLIINDTQRMLPAFSDCCAELVDKWEKMAGFEECFELDVWLELQGLTGDVLSRTAFGSNFEEGRRIFKLQEEQTQILFQSMRYAYIPGYRFLPTRTNNRMKEIDSEIKTVLRGIINKREESVKIGEGITDDLLGFLLESNMQEFQKHGSRKAGMTTDEVIHECKLLYFAGQETTSILLTWTMVLLSMYPSWQERAREEVLHVFGKDDPDFDGLSRLKTVTMILYEVLRLYPTGTSLLRQTYKTMKVGDVVYPPGVLLVLFIIFVHHDPEVWGNDAKEFNPERFAEGFSKATNSFFPFGRGPRICIGQNFALLEAKIGLSMILQRFTFDLSPSYVHAPHTVITVQPQYGAQLRLRKL